MLATGATTDKEQAVAEPAAMPTQRGILGWIERSGNKLPDPVFLFFWLIAILVVVSIVASLAGWSVLHPTEIDESVEMIRRIHSRGVTILIVEHVVRAVTALSRRLVVLDQGRVISEGEPAAVMSDPAVITAYLGDWGRRA